MFGSIVPFRSSIRITLLGLALAMLQKPAGQEFLDTEPSGPYEELVDILLPLAPLDPPIFLDDLKWFAAVRIMQENSIWYATIRRTFQGDVTAQIVIPLSPIVDQLRQLKRMRPDSETVELAELIEIKRRFMTEESCPALNQIAEGFENLQASPVLSSAFLLHPTQYELTSQWLSNVLFLKYYGPGKDAQKQPHPIVEWMESLRTELEGCASS